MGSCNHSPQAHGRHCARHEGVVRYGSSALGYGLTYNLISIPTPSKSLLGLCQGSMVVQGPRVGRWILDIPYAGWNTNTVFESCHGALKAVLKYGNNRLIRMHVD